MLSKLTNTESAVSAVEFTTLTAIPGNLMYKGARIQLLDTPGIIEGASQGKGKGRQVVATARTADLLVIMLDPTREIAQKKILEHELDAVGIRINTSPPDITITKKKTGGLSWNSTLPLTYIDNEMVRTIMHEYSTYPILLNSNLNSLIKDTDTAFSKTEIHNADVLFRCDATVDQFIDVIEGKRSYIPCLYVRCHCYTEA